MAESIISNVAALALGISAKLHLPSLISQLTAYQEECHKCTADGGQSRQNKTECSRFSHAEQPVIKNTSCVAICPFHCSRMVQARGSQQSHSVRSASSRSRTEARGTRYSHTIAYTGLWSGIRPVHIMSQVSCDLSM